MESSCAGFPGHYYHLILVRGRYGKPDVGSSSERLPSHYIILFLVWCVFVRIFCVLFLRANSRIFVTLREPFSSELCVLFEKPNLESAASGFAVATLVLGSIPQPFMLRCIEINLDRNSRQGCLEILFALSCLGGKSGTHMGILGVGRQVGASHIIS